MNIEQQLNKMLDYIEANLFEELNIKKLSQFIGVNSFNFKSFFSILTGQTITSYIKKRRLSEVVKLLKNQKIIDVAIQCGYDSRISFSRAFKNFHGFSPSKLETNFNYYPKIQFKQNIISSNMIKAEYKNLPSLILYGESIEFDSYKQINAFCNTMKKKYQNLKNSTKWYGLVFKHNQTLKYFVALEEKFDNSNEKITIPSATWLSTKIDNQYAKNIQQLGKQIKSKELNIYPDIEIYTQDKVELLYKVENKSI